MRKKSVPILRDLGLLEDEFGMAETTTLPLSHVAAALGVDHDEAKRICKKRGLSIGHRRYGTRSVWYVSNYSTKQRSIINDSGYRR